MDLKDSYLYGIFIMSGTESSSIILYQSLGQLSSYDIFRAAPPSPMGEEDPEREDAHEHERAANQPGERATSS